MSSVSILVTASHPEKRIAEPVTLGIPWPQASIKDESCLSLVDEQGKECPIQTNVLDRWKDGSIRWLLLDFQAHVTGTTHYQLVPQRSSRSSMPNLVLRLQREPHSFCIDTGPGRFTCVKKKQAGFLQFQQANGNQLEASLQVLDEQGNSYVPDIQTIVIEEEGMLRSSICLSGSLQAVNSEKSLADLFIRIHCYAGKAFAKFDVTIRNPRKAEHPGGLWDLGNGGSIYLEDAAIVVKPVGQSESGQGRLSIHPDHESVIFSEDCELYQDSSGGNNWKSSNHVNRKNVVPLSFSGYRTSVDDKQYEGKRATPVLTWQSTSHAMALAAPDFWQNFPKALEADGGEITYRLFPRQSADVHELQGGEQKSHLFYVAFAQDTITDQPLEWCRAPVFARAEPSWYAQSGTIPWLTPRDTDPHAEYLRLVDAALDGGDTFAHKREVIDEFGWRHYGDIYGDHEAVFHQGPQPLVSHYNNQYDAIAGLGYQYMRSGDARWLTEMEAHARHVIDIDIYHTTQDKAAYNQGLFWHTFHYVDACTGTHRSYPRDARVPPHGRPVPGGGPANEQNYSTGLMLHYFLTGYRPSRDTALGLAQWVVDMDDGSKTIFRWLSRGYTGTASKSRTTTYHGPGRGSANSILVLMDGCRLSQDRKYLEKAEQIIRRCIHPEDRIEQNNLLDAENRWFYTMFLQALGKYLHYKEELGEHDAMYAYAQTSLVKYARWMADHEYPYLSKPELLEYPTETWAAQDMRKCEIFNQASLHCEEAEKERFRRKADEYFQYSVKTLSGMATKTLCRPVVLMLNYGFAHDWFVKHGSATAPRGTQPLQGFGKPTVFVPQRQIAVRRAKMIIVTGGLLMLAATAWLFYRWLA